MCGRSDWLGWQGTLQAPLPGTPQPHLACSKEGLAANTKTNTTTTAPHLVNLQLTRGWKSSLAQLCPFYRFHPSCCHPLRQSSFFFLPSLPSPRPLSSVIRLFAALSPISTSPRANLPRRPPLRSSRPPPRTPRRPFTPTVASDRRPARKPPGTPFRRARVKGTLDSNAPTSFQRRAVTMLSWRFYDTLQAASRMAGWLTSVAALVVMAYVMNRWPKTGGAVAAAMVGVRS